MAQAIILSIALDLFLIGLVVAGCLVGVYKGFLKSVMKPVRIALSVFLSALISKPISRVLVVPLIKAPLNNKIQSYILNFIEKHPDKNLPTLVKLAAALNGVDVNGEDVISVVVDRVGEITAPIVEIIALVITFCVLLVIFILLIKVGCHLLDFLIKDTGLNKVNKTFGAIFNGLLGFVVGWVFVVVFDLFVHLPVFESGWLGMQFKGGLLYRLLLNFSPIEMLLSF